MTSKDLFISFKGPHVHGPLFRGLFEWLRAIKSAAPSGSGSVGNRDSLIYSSEWVSFIDEITLSRIGAEDVWSPEDIIDCILSGEYLLVSLDLSDDQTGVLHYCPNAYPFGGTDPLKALVELYGYSVTGDSLQDIYRTAPVVASPSAGKLLATQVRRLMSFLFTRNT